MRLMLVTQFYITAAFMCKKILCLSKSLYFIGKRSQHLRSLVYLLVEHYYCCHKQLNCVT